MNWNIVFACVLINAVGLGCRAWNGRSNHPVDLKRLPPSDLARLFLDPNLRPKASRELERRGVEARPAIPILIEVLKSKDWNARIAAIRTLGALSQDGDTAANAIVSVVESEPRDSLYAGLVLGMAYEKLASMAGGTGAVRCALSDIRSHDPAIRKLAVLYLGAHADVCPPGATELISRLLRDPEAVVRRNAARSLGLFGARASGKLTDLEALVSDENAEVGRAAREAIERISAAAP